MFQEESRTVQVNGKAVSGDYQYNVDYSVNNDNLSRLHCEITKTVTDEIDTPTGKQPVTTQRYIGYLLLESGSKQMSLPESENVTAHLTVFDQITKEVKVTLEAKPAPKSK
ncbi:hypothetical protein [Bacteroides fragilis]|uniref:hypothetical protein n=1 Tax=Bacteroides fragilis TaxID=817 RepID=UPI0028124933|nr:hypothetical protein [Bacteroides fragilis]WMI95590.1 hypothetical protein BFGS084_03022 [Bacteroides fragilis]